MADLGSGAPANAPSLAPRASEDRSGAMRDAIAKLMARSKREVPTTTSAITSI